MKVSLPVFEGPLDLLLHLIRKHELDIFDIPIKEITEHYLAAIEDMKELNLDLAGEFIQMAAELLLIKSKMLLPPDEAEDVAPGEEIPDIDPRNDLVRRLLEYQKYKDAAAQLMDRDILNRDVFPPAHLAQIMEDGGLAEVSVFALLSTLDGIMKRVENAPQHVVTGDRLSVRQRMDELLAQLAGQTKRFAELFDSAVSKSQVVITFLAVLELVRLKYLRVHQPEDEDILVTPIGEVTSLRDGDTDTFETPPERPASEETASEGAEDRDASEPTPVDR